MLLDRSLMASLLCADSSVRAQLFKLYGTFEESQNNAEHVGEISADVAGIPGRSPVDVLWQLLHSDWEGLGMRLWIIVFIELFILTAHHEGGVELANSCLK